jgi:hypothetical protein
MTLPAAPGLQCLSACLGTPVQDTNGHRLGRVADLEARPGPGCPPVIRLLVRHGRRVEPISWAAVRRFDAQRVVVDRGQVGDGPDEEGLLLARDVLDTQVMPGSPRGFARIRSRGRGSTWRPAMGTR